MGFINDMLAMFKKRELSFIESIKESEEVYTFLFEKEKDLTWQAGQYGLITISHKKIKNPTKPMSLASAPSENVVRFTTRVGKEPSEFKKAMLELKQGMKVGMQGPLGSFTLQDDRPSLLIAGGIGITPFRSILKQLEAEENRASKPIQLLYMDSNKSFLFKDELDEIASKTSISLAYLDSRDDLHQEIDKFTTLYKNNGQYFIAGSKSMVDSIFTILQNRNISKRDIKKDTFFGY